MSRIAVVAHKYLPQPDDDLVSHLNQRGNHSVLHVCHSFPDAPDRCSSWFLYENGRLAGQGRSRDYRRWPDALVYVKEMLFTLYWGWRLGPWDRYIGMDGLCTFFGHLLRAVGAVRRTVFWAIDFVPSNRFASAVKNRVYSAINRHSATKADEMWDLSPRMAEARERYAGIRPDEYRAHRVVPYGLWLHRIRRVPYAECEPLTVVFMGHLLEKQGVQLVLRALPSITAHAPGVRFKVIGGGSYRDTLETLAKQLGVSDRCDFLGKIERLEDVEAEIARSAVAVAPYVRALDTWTAYADPGKVKTYLACGVPVVLTDLPWNAREIEQAGCGVVVPEDTDAIAQAVLRLLEPGLNARMRAAAGRYALSFDYANIFASALPADASVEAPPQGRLDPATGPER
jgi:glycosyltransferase involved in cell wall biosynthesis